MTTNSSEPEVPAVSWEVALETLTGPSGPFEIVDAEIRGETHKVFSSTPPSLRHLFQAARGHGDKPFLVYEDELWSFAEIVDRVDAIGSMLVEHYGIKPGDRVGIAMRNYPEWIASFAAITSVGAIAVSLNAWWTTEEIDYALEDSGCRLLIADKERIDRAAPALERLGILAVVVRSEGELPSGVDRLEDVVVAGAPLPEVAIEPDHDAMILYTSGTTGHPKGAVATHRAVLTALTCFACAATANRMSQPAKEPSPWPVSFILIVPLFHVTGLVPVMLGCFAGGYKLVMMYKWNPERALELIEREHITQFVGVPTMSWDLLESPEFASHDTSSLLSVGGGGAPAPPELVTKIDKGFKSGRPGIGYGMTETNAYGPQNSGDDYLRKPRSAGRAVPVLQVKVADEAGKELPRGEVGEIYFRGANLIRGYWNNPEATAEAFIDGWFHSGDLGRMDEAGFIFVEDRAKDMVLRAGENVYSAEVEAAIYTHPAIHEAAVFGIPHERLGEEVSAAVIAKAGHSIDVEELREFLKQHLAGFKIPSVIEVHSEPLPRNAAGKFLKRDLRDQLVARRAG
ncbi:MAG: acyl--CoA ligase [Deltaproteobacteria bacterium]|nr:acyl--CoA ligase [Deltaproteobacteria bacterium]